MKDDERDFDSQTPGEADGAGEFSDNPDGEADSSRADSTDDSVNLHIAIPGFVIKEALEWGKALAVALVLALILKATVIQAYVIPTSSMEPTVMPNDRIFGLRIVYRFSDPEVGDIIAFKPPPAATGGEKTPSFLKRVIATEGDTIEVLNGKVYLNGVALNEPYIKASPDYEYPPTRIPKGKLFVLGDNRRNSKDSHRWGFVPRKNVQVKAVLRFWPPKRIGIVK